MCQGHFIDSDTPVITAFLFIPGIPDADFRPVVDTGSPITILSYTDAKTNGIDLSRLKKETEKSHVLQGEINLYFADDVELALLDEKKGPKVAHLEQLDRIYFFPKDAEYMDSILGMDILRRFELRINQPKNLVELTGLPVPPDTQYTIKFK
jgi:hypothetical protein